MINKMTEEWGRIEDTVTRGVPKGPPESKDVLTSIAQVREVLRRMCQVSVTRTTLQAAVFEALGPVLEEHGPELLGDVFSQIAELRARVDGLGAAGQAQLQVAGDSTPSLAEDSLSKVIEERLNGFEARIHRLAEAEAETRTSMEAVSERVDGLDSGMAVFDGRLTALSDRLKGVDAALCDGVAEVSRRVDGLEERFGASDSRHSALSAGLDALQARAGDLGSGLDGALSELSALRGRASALEDRAGSAEGFLGELSGGLDVVRARLGGAEGRLEAAEGRLGAAEGGLEEARGFVAREVESLRTTFEERLRSGLFTVEMRLESAKDHLLGLVSRLEAAVPVTVGNATGELERRLREEIEIMVRGIEEKLADLRGILGRLDETLPRRESVELLGERLGRLEATGEQVAEQVGRIDSLTPQLRGIDDRFGNLKAQIEELAGTVRSTEGEVGGLRDALGGQIGDLHRLLDEGIRRWEADQSQMLERLGAVRDTLKDQYRAVAEQVREGDPSVWGKLTGRGQGGLKLSKEDWDRLSAKIEGVLSGLEAILTKRRGS